MGMWDGNGFADKAYSDLNSSSYHEYQTYKLGLALILSNDLKIVNSSVNNLIAKIISVCQEEDGGIITGYELRNGSIERSQFATANTETTAIIALANVHYVDPVTADYWIAITIALIIIGCMTFTAYWWRRSHASKTNRTLKAKPK